MTSPHPARRPAATHRPAAARALLVAAAATAAALVLAACSSATGATSATGGSGASSAAVPAAVTDAVAAGYQGLSTAPPTSSPAVSPGHDLWVVSAFQQVSGLAKIASEAQAAAAAIGWKATVCDGQNNPAQWSTCVRQATAAGADAILLAGVDCAPVSEALAEARRGGVKVTGVASFDCDDPTQGGGAPQFDAKLGYTDGVTGTGDFYEKAGRLRADWVIAKTGGSAKVLHVAFKGVSIGEYLSKGFTEELAAQCPGCSVVGTVAITPSEIGQLRQKFDSALLKAPDANVVVTDLDFMLSAGVQQSLQQNPSSGRVVLGGECVQETLDYIRAGGGAQACVGFSNGRAAWAAVDQLNRAFDGQPGVTDGVGSQIIDAERNLPAAGSAYEGDLDYRATYTQLWKAAA
ncbi:sugar ABC transporter substrate-binding protein [Quadrisphaera oryzae]|uniref:sugar ABC transporter substrate-binding protein n=1 Tax=Quadrisphaera TaxID=317661 RepID=UPI0016485CAB|nr:substrate-binding domain-containing protein [Quadrisphaera sp. RL12-1S]MBC3762639.1 substrate-binding domain-containing protein [Quadrisphaera sp. RL12-1S]